MKMRTSAILTSIFLAATVASAMPLVQEGKELQILNARARGSSGGGQRTIDTSDQFKNNDGKTFPKGNLYNQSPLFGETSHKDSHAPPAYSEIDRVGGSAPQKGGQKPPSYGTAEHEGILDQM